MTTDNESDVARLHMIPPPPVLSQEQKMPLPRPASVIVIGILCLAGFAFDLLVVFLPLKSSSPFILFLKINDGIFSAILLVMGIGLLRWQSWARKGTIITIILRVIVFTIYTFLYNINVHPNPTFSTTTGTITFSVFTGLTMLYFGTLIFFLTRPGVKAAFAD